MADRQHNGRRADALLMRKGFGGTLRQNKSRNEAEQVKSVKYELMGFLALLFLLFLFLSLPGGQDVRSKIRSPAELIMSSHVVPLR